MKLCHMHIVHTDPNWFERWQLTEMYAAEFGKKHKLEKYVIHERN